MIYQILDEKFSKAKVKGRYKVEDQEPKSRLKTDQVKDIHYAKVLAL